MIIDKDNMMEWAEKYLDKVLNAETMVKINNQLANDDVLRKEWHKTINFLTNLKHLSEREHFKLMYDDVKRKHKPGYKNTFQHKTVDFFRKYGKISAMAAGLALIASVITYLSATNTSKIKSDNQFVSLKREIQTIKNSQARINQSLDEVTKEHKETDNIHIYQGNEVGTGFALSNDGFVVTDYHVVKSADSIYIQTNNSEYYKAFVVAYNEQTDLAVLKVQNNDFKFGDGPIPYTFSKNDAPLAQEIFSLGFPQDEALYTEGYISSKAGYEGNDQYYQLNMPANPGQSGAPVFDKNGNIIAMVIGKQTYSTYAAKSQVLLDMLKDFPITQDLKLNKRNAMNGLSRTEQVKKALNYVCAVRVYK